MIGAVEVIVSPIHIGHQVFGRERCIRGDAIVKPGNGQQPAGQ